ncbi:unnamed protein product [Rodentolepis nana]|uniref:Reverse transcriptase n=1 Tax=Rodentolepis nana TaxID=102285 RepID=A0A0R3TDQ0_RODNA|nr:unnamed protein product [Rodentolepis nana]
MIRCAKKNIPRGKTKHYRVFWSEHLKELKRKRDTLEHLKELKRKRDTLRNTADQTGRTEDVQAWRWQDALRKTADQTGRTAWRWQAILQAKRTSFNEFVSTTNYQSDSQRTFKFLGYLQNNRERPKKEPIRFNNKLLNTDSEIANCFASFYSHRQKKNTFVIKSSIGIKIQVW